MTEPGRDDRPTPHGAGTPGQFVAALRALKAWSGLSYRALEKRAAETGDALPRATVTGALARDSLPRAELVGALVRACGGTAAEAAEWISARHRIAAASMTNERPEPMAVVLAAEPTTPPPVVVRAASPGPAPPATPPPPGPGPEQPRRKGWPRRRVAAGLVLVLAAIAVTALLSAGSRTGGAIGAPKGPRDDGRPSSAAATAPSSRAGSGPSGGPSPATAPAGGAPSGSRPAPGRSSAPPESFVQVVAADTTVVEGVPDAANGHDKEVSTCGQPCAASSVPAFHRQVLLKFPAAPAPSGLCVWMTGLRIWAKAAPGTVAVYPADSHWTEETASWNLRPATGARLAAATGSTAPGWLSFRFHESTPAGTEHAFLLDGTDARTGAFAAREDVTIARPAELTIAYVGC